MRTKHVLALLTTAGLVLSGGLAYAGSDRGTDRPPPPATARVPKDGPVTVTLVTGDQVRVVGDGPVQLLPGKGREQVGYHTRRVRGGSGDRVVVPLDVADEVASGKLDARLFNVDALLRNGITDAGTVASADALGPAPAGWRSGEPSADATTVTVRFRWLDGGVPDYGGGGWLNLDNGERGFYQTTDGSAELALPPGRYSLVGTMTDAGSRFVGTVTDLTVGATPQVVPIDGRRAQRLSFDLDRDAVPAGHELEFFTDQPGGERGLSVGVFVPGQYQLFGIPSQASPGSHHAGLVWHSELTNPTGAARPYSYSLLHLEQAGVPRDLSFRVRNRELAVRRTSYRGLGRDASLARSNVATHPAHMPFTWLPPSGYGTPVATPSVRTEYYTADPDVSWSQRGAFSGGGEDAPTDDVLRHGGPMKPGHARTAWLSAPLSVGVSDPWFPYFGSGVTRWPLRDGSNVLAAWPPMFTAGTGDEFTMSWGLDGESVLSRDGEELGRQKGPIVGAVLPPGDSGRYTLSVDLARQVPWTPLGTRSTARWEFESGPVTEETAVNVSVVRFDATGIRDGYAPAHAPQRVHLEYVTQPGAEHSTCTAMTFEVSYDDGRTWRQVKLTRSGDHATATLRHPADARFVSVRFTATDEAGNTVHHSTLRSYRLR